MVGFVYKIENKKNGKIYIGQTIKPKKERWYRHLYDLRNGKHANPYLQHSYNKYGENSFEFQPIEHARTIDELNTLEQQYIQEMDTLNRSKGYNLLSGGKNGEHSEETKQRISKALIGHGCSEETRKKMSEANKGENNPNYRKGKNKGYKHTLETRKKISEKGKGKIISKEQRKKISQELQGGLFGFRGATHVNKTQNPWTKVWQCKIRFNGKKTSLGYFHDPLSAQIVFDIVFEEVYKKEAR